MALGGAAVLLWRAMNLDAIAIGHHPPEDVNTIIEVPIAASRSSTRWNKAAGTLVVDRFLYTPMRYPGNYGFVPHTLSGRRRSDRCAGRHTARSCPAR